MKASELFAPQDRRWLIEYEIIAHERSLPVWGYREVPEPDSGVSWSDVKDSWRNLDEEPEHCWYEVPYTSHGDYVGGAVEESNYNELLEMCKQADQPYAIAIGDFGSRALFIRDDADDDELLRVIRKLDDYPVVDEEAWSEVEREREEEAWDNWVRSDFVHELTKHFDLEEWEPTDEESAELFERLRERANVYWVHETGDSVFIDLKRIVQEAALDDLPASAKAVLDALAVAEGDEETIRRLEEERSSNNPNQLKFNFDKEEA